MKDRKIKKHDIRRQKALKKRAEKDKIRWLMKMLDDRADMCYSVLYDKRPAGFPADLPPPRSIVYHHLLDYYKSWEDFEEELKMSLASHLGMTLEAFIAMMEAE